MTDIETALQGVPWKCEQCGVILPAPCIQRLVTPGIHAVRPVPDWLALAAVVRGMVKNKILSGIRDGIALESQWTGDPTDADLEKEPRRNKRIGMRRMHRRLVGATIGLLSYRDRF